MRCCPEKTFEDRYTSYQNALNEATHLQKIRKIELENRIESRHIERSEWSQWLPQWLALQESVVLESEIATGGLEWDPGSNLSFMARNSATLLVQAG